MATWTRRRVIGTLPGVAASGLLAGCSEDQSRNRTPPPDIVVFNDTSTDTTATVQVSGDGSDDLLVSESVTIVAREAAEYPDALPSPGTFTLSVDVQNGPTADTTRSISDDAESFQAIVRNESIEFRIRRPTSH